MEDKTEAFWLVWNPDRSMPSHKHTTEYAAVNEAERLARQHPGEMFVVLQSICARVTDDMRRIDMKPFEPPF